MLRRLSPFIVIGQENSVSKLENRYKHTNESAEVREYRKKAADGAKSINK